jgi:hypothetical protein
MLPEMSSEKKGHSEEWPVSEMYVPKVDQSLLVTLISTMGKNLLSVRG